MAGYGSIYPAYGGYGFGGCHHDYPLNYHSHGSLLGTAIGGLITGDYSGYQYAPNPVYPSFPIGGYGLGYGGYGLGGFGMGGYGMGYGGFGGFGGMGYGGFGGLGYGGYGGYGYGFGSVPYGGFFWGSRPNIPSCTGHFNNYRSGEAVEAPQSLHPDVEPPVAIATPPKVLVNNPVAYKTPVTQASLFRL
jgi:hypothetical protein